jgi:hypothetical protein
MNLNRLKQLLILRKNSSYKFNKIHTKKLISLDIYLRKIKNTYIIISCDLCRVYLLLSPKFKSHIAGETHHSKFNYFCKDCCKRINGCN